MLGMNRVGIIKKAVFIYLLILSAAIIAEAATTAPLETHPFFASSLTGGGSENISTYRFRTINNYSTPTKAFRLWISSNFDWFDPLTFSFPLAPDRIEGGNFYWDVPPLLPNESMEVSFSVKRRVGLPESIDATAETISKWTGTCKYPIQTNISPIVQNRIRNYLSSINQTENITIYYSYRLADNSTLLVLTHLAEYNVFATFIVSEIASENNVSNAVVYNNKNKSGVELTGDKKLITEIVTSYITKYAPKSNANLSKSYEALLSARSLKIEAETECLRITGLGRYNCTDRESCRYACFSVPVCASVGQSGWVFLDFLRDFKLKLDQANGQLDRTYDTSKMLRGQPSYKLAKTTYDELVALNRAETKVVYHPIITSYGFCPTPNYGLPLQMEGKRELLNYLETNCLEGEKELLISECSYTATKIGAIASGNMNLDKNITGTTTIAGTEIVTNNNTNRIVNITNDTTTLDYGLAGDKRTDENESETNDSKTPSPCAASATIITAIIFGSIFVRKYRT